MHRNELASASVVPANGDADHRSVWGGRMNFPRLSLGWAWFALAVLALGGAAVIARYSHVSASEENGILFLDRWRGDVCAANKRCVPIRPK